MSIAPLIMFRIGNRIGLDGIKPCSFPKATIEPVNVTAPIANPKPISNKDPPDILPISPIPYAVVFIVILYV